MLGLGKLLSRFITHKNKMKNQKNSFCYSLMVLAFSFSVFPILANATSIIISEVNPAGDWVELQNTTASDVDLTGWEVSRMANAGSSSIAVDQSVSLSGAIPANGLVTVSVPNLDSEVDIVSLYEGDLVDQVAYGNVDYDLATTTPPTSNNSLAFYSDSWHDESATLGWFNHPNTGLSLLDFKQDLLDLDIDTNLADLVNPTQATGLYFDKSGVGRIEFPDELNLTSGGTVATFENFANNLTIANKLVEFNPESSSVLKNSSSTITMRGLTNDYTVNSLKVTSGGVVVDTDQAIASFSQDSETKNVTIDVNHFTKFELTDNPGGWDLDETAPTGSIISPTPGYMATSTLVISAEVTDDESGVDRVVFYLDGDDGDEIIGTSESVDGDGNYSISWNPLGQSFSDGNHQLFARLYNQDGYSTTTASQLLELDATIPIATVSYNPDNISDDDITATLGGSNRAITILNNGGLAEHIFTETGSFTYLFVDEVGHSGSSTASVTINRTTPEISGLSPVSGSHVNGQTALVFTVSPGVTPRCGIDSTNFYPCSNFDHFNDIFEWWDQDLANDGPFTLYIQGLNEANTEAVVSADYVKDTVTPEFVSASSTALNTIRVKFSEDLETSLSALSGHYLTAEDFEVSGKTISGFSENNGLVTLTLSSPFSDTAPSTTLVINPHQPESIADLAGNQLTEKMIISVVDGMNPTISSAFTSNEDQIILNFSENLQTPINSADFTVNISRDGEGSSLAISSLSYTNKQITLNLSDGLQSDDVISLTIKASSSVKDLSNNSYNYGNQSTINVANMLSGSSGGGGGGSGGSTPVNPPVNNSGEVLGAEIFRFTKNLSYCMEDGDVRELQLRLIKEGYLQAEVTGYFGPLTLAAVKKYQQAHSLPVTGYVGPMTRSILNGGADNASTEAQINSIYEQLLNIQKLLNEIVSGN